MPPSTFNRTRMAPTPSGYLHLGNILSFALTAALARKTGARILLRIDDFDMERTNRLFIQDIFDTLSFLAIPWDDGPRTMQEYENEYSQRHRMNKYNAALEQLKEGGCLFACKCSRTQVLSVGPDQGYPGTCRNLHIPLDTENTSWRLHTTDTLDLRVKTLSGTVATHLPQSMRDFIARRKDRIPAYQLISVLDDLHYGVDLVVRGDDLWASTLAQHYLAQALQLPAFAGTTFYHHPLIMGPDGNKLSKSEGATSVHYLRKEHKTVADIYNSIGRALRVDGDVRNWEELVAKLDILPADM